MRHFFLFFFLTVIIPAFSQVPPRRPVEGDTAMFQERQLGVDKQRKAKKKDSLTIEMYDSQGV